MPSLPHEKAAPWLTQLPILDSHTLMLVPTGFFWFRDFHVMMHPLGLKM